MPREVSLRKLVRCALFLFVCTSTALAQSRREQALLDDFDKRRTKFLIEAGQRHLELGVDVRKKGLVSQATTQLILAVEVSRGRNPGANRVLAIMRSLEDRFWKKRLLRPSKAKLDAYAARAERIRRENLEEHFDLAKWAHKKGLAEEALEEFESILRRIDRALEVNGAGVLVTPAGNLPGDVSDAILEGAVSINGRPYLRDAFLERLPGTDQIFEAASETLLVRCQTAQADALALHRLGEELFDHLETAMSGTPDRRPSVFVFQEESLYRKYLAAKNLAHYAVAKGYADFGAYVAVVCAEGLDTETVQAVFLHELTHLYDYGVSPTVLPSWYREGMADTYGGQGTFRWDGETLEAGGMLSEHRLAALLAPDGARPLGELLRGNAIDELGRDRDAGLRFYAQAWAFLRFLRTGAGPSVATRFERWEAICRGSAIGADLKNPYKRDASDATGLFMELFGKDLGELEAAFADWLAAL